MIYYITIQRRNGLRYKDAYFGRFTPGEGEYLEPREGDEACYAKGWSPPNYPMPAIPYEVQYTGKSVCVFHRSGSCEHDVYFLKS